MAAIVPLPDAVADLVRDGDSVALEGFTHLIPYAAGHELLRQRRSELELRELCRAKLPTAPFLLTAHAWAARGVA